MSRFYFTKEAHANGVRLRAARRLRYMPRYAKDACLFTSRRSPPIPLAAAYFYAFDIRVLARYDMRRR